MPTAILKGSKPRFSCETSNKVEGNASIRVDYSTKTFGFSPNFNGSMDLTEYDGLSLAIYNPDPRKKHISFQFRTPQAGDYNCYLRHQDERPFDIYGMHGFLPAGPGWSNVRFYADCVHVNKPDSITHGKSLLGGVTQITVLVTDRELEKESYLLVDNIELLKRSPVTPAVPQYPETFAAGDPRQADTMKLLDQARHATENKDYAASLGAYLKVLDLSPFNRDAVKGVKEVYALHLNNGARNRLKARLRLDYRDTVVRDREKAQGFSSLHQALVDIWSENSPLFSYGMGTQTQGVKYQFTKDSRLVETARRIYEMGSDTLKTNLSRQALSDNYGLDAARIHTLTEMAQDAQFRTVFAMPFKNYLLWAYPLQQDSWMDKDIPATQKQKDIEYHELRDLAEYLLKTYRGSGKTFLLGTWESDYHLRLDKESKYGDEPSPVRIQNMIDWCNIRQRAIDDAKQTVPHDNVTLYHYIEVVHVPQAMLGATMLVNSILPYAQVDLVSYSSYSTTDAEFIRTGQTPGVLWSALDFIEKNLPPRDIPGKRVWIGEYGHPYRDKVDETQQAECCRVIAKAALKWGCPFVLVWEIYDNEGTDGSYGGYSLIDSHNRKKPIYFLHEDYLKAARSYVETFRQANHRGPSQAEFSRVAPELLDRVAIRKWTGIPYADQQPPPFVGRESGDTVEDPLTDLSHVFGKSDNMTAKPVTQMEAELKGLAIRADGRAGHLVYKLKADISSFQVTVQHLGNNAETLCKCHLSPDGKKWDTLNIKSHSRRPADKKDYSYSELTAAALPEGSHYLKIELVGLEGNYTAMLSRVRINVPLHESSTKRAP